MLTQPRCPLSVKNQSFVGVLGALLDVPAAAPCCTSGVACTAEALLQCFFHGPTSFREALEYLSWLLVEPPAKTFAEERPLSACIAAAGGLHRLAQ